jgi:hypothetical protein
VKHSEGDKVVVNGKDGVVVAVGKGEFIGLIKVQFADGTEVQAKNTVGDTQQVWPRP